MRGPRPEPTHLKLIKGNPGKRAIPKDEPAPPLSVPKAPDILSGEARDEWKRITRRLFNLGLVSQIDRAALAAYCMAWARWVTAEQTLAAMAENDDEFNGLLVRNPETGALSSNPLVAQVARAAADVVKFSAEFGMTPSARSRVKASPAKKKGDSKFAGLLRGAAD